MLAELSLEGLVGEVADIALDYPALTKGIAASLRTLVVASFRAPRTRVMFQVESSSAATTARVVFRISLPPLPSSERNHRD